MARRYVSETLVKAVKCRILSGLIALGILLTISLFVNHILLYFVGGMLLLPQLFEGFVREWMPKKRVSPEGKAVFISGCDRGFGYMLAQKLDDIGFQVFAGCLFPDGDGAANLRKSGSQRLHVIGLDVTSDTSVAEATAYVEENLSGNKLWAVVNNAGVGILGEVHWIRMEEIDRITDVNLLGVVRVTKAFLPKLKESEGKILTVASFAGKDSTPGIVPYSMTKAAVIAFCDGLRLELYKWGIQVICIEPLFYRTTIIDEKEVTQITEANWKRASKDAKDMYDSNYITTFIRKMNSFFRVAAKNPSEVISVMEDAIMNSHAEYCYKPGSHIMRLASWLSQSLPKPISDILKLYTILGKDLM